MSQKPFVKKPRPFTRRPINRFGQQSAVAAEITTDQGLIQQLFLEVSGGKLFSIDKFLNDKNITLDVVDDEHNSVIHSVLKSSNLDNDEKYSLILKLIDRGAPITVMNDHNETPLHLACKNQMPKLVKLLISRGAEVNKPNGQMKTPIHFAVSPESAECVVDVNEKPRKTLIPIEERKVVENKTFYDLKKEVVKQMKNSAVAKMGLKHIANVMQEPSVHHDEKSEKRAEAFLNDVAATIKKDRDDGIDPRNNVRKKQAAFIAKEEEIIRAKVSGSIKSNELIAKDKYYDEAINKAEKSLASQKENFDKAWSEVGASMNRYKSEYGKITNAYSNMMFALEAVSNPPTTGRLPPGAILTGGFIGRPHDGRRVRVMKGGVIHHNKENAKAIAGGIINPLIAAGTPIAAVIAGWDNLNNRISYSTPAPPITMDERGYELLDITDAEYNRIKNELKIANTVLDQVGVNVYVAANITQHAPAKPEGFAAPIFQLPANNPKNLPTKDRIKQDTFADADVNALATTDTNIPDAAGAAPPPVIPLALVVPDSQKLNKLLSLFSKAIKKLAEPVDSFDETIVPPNDIKVYRYESFGFTKAEYRKLIADFNDLSTYTDSSQKLEAIKALIMRTFSNTGYNLPQNTVIADGINDAELNNDIAVLNTEVENKEKDYRDDQVSKAENVVTEIKNALKDPLKKAKKAGIEDDIAVDKDNVDREIGALEEDIKTAKANPLDDKVGTILATADTLRDGNVKDFIDNIELRVEIKEATDVSTGSLKVLRNIAKAVNDSYEEATKNGIVNQDLEDLRKNYNDQGHITQKALNEVRDNSADKTKLDSLKAEITTLQDKAQRFVFYIKLLELKTALENAVETSDKAVAAVDPEVVALKTELNNKLATVKDLAIALDDAKDRVKFVRNKNSKLEEIRRRFNTADKPKIIANKDAVRGAITDALNTVAPSVDVGNADQKITLNAGIVSFKDIFSMSDGDKVVYPESTDDFNIKYKAKFGEGNVTNPKFNYHTIKDATDITIRSNKFTVFNLMNYNFEQIERIVDSMKGGSLDFNLADVNTTLTELVDEYKKKVIQVMLFLPGLRQTTEGILRNELLNMAKKLRALPDPPVAIVFSSGPKTPSAPYREFFNRYADYFTDAANTIVGEMVKQLGKCYQNVINLQEPYNKYIESLNRRYAIECSRFIVNGTGINNIPFVAFSQVVDIEEKSLDIVMGYYKGVDAYRKDLIKKYYPKNIQKKMPQYVLIGGAASKASLGYIDFVHNNDNGPFANDPRKYHMSGREIEYELQAGSNITGRPAMVIPVAAGNISDESFTIPILEASLDEHFTIVKSLIRQDLIDNPSVKAKGRDYATELGKETGITDDESNNEVVAGVINSIIDEIYQRGITSLARTGAKRFTDYNAKKYEKPKPSRPFPIDEDSNLSYEDIRRKADEAIVKKIDNTTGDVTSVIQIVSNFQEKQQNEDNKPQHIVRNMHENEVLCYNVDTDTLDEMINAGADLNFKDKSGRTPIFYAIDLKHTEMIEKLLASRTVTTYSDRSKDKSGYTPYVHAAKKLNGYIMPYSIVDMFKKSGESVLKDIEKEIRLDQVLVTSELIMPWVLYLVNHQLTNLEYSTQRPGYGYGDDVWSYTDHKELVKICNVNDNNLPYIKMEQKGDAGDDSHVVAELTAKFTKQRAKLENQKQAFVNSIREIDNEIGELDNTKVTDKYRIKKLQKLKDVYEAEYDRIVAAITDVDAQLSKVENVQDAKNMMIMGVGLQKVLSGEDLSTEDDSVITIYDKIFDKLKDTGSGDLGENLTIYIQRWKEMLDDNKYDDNTQFPLIVLNVLAKDNSKIDFDSYQYCNLCCKYLTRVLGPNIDDYFQIPRHYQRYNSMLDSLVAVYEHVIRHTLCVRYNSMMLRMTLDHLTKLNPDDPDGNMKKFEKIFSSDTDSAGKPVSPVMKYIIYEMPNLIVRNILSVHKHDRDEAAVTTVNELLKKAVKMIADNGEVPLDNEENGTFLADIYKYIVPYFELYFRKFVEAMNENVEIYLKMLKSICIDANIFRMIYDYSKNEKMATAAGNGS